MDLKSCNRWYDYSRARDAMFAATDTAWAPWHITDADDKKRARLSIISHLLSQVPYKPLAHQDTKLPNCSRSAARRRASSAASNAVDSSGYPMAIRSAMMFPFLGHSRV